MPKKNAFLDNLQHKIKDENWVILMSRENCYFNSNKLKIQKCTPSSHESSRLPLKKHPWSQTLLHLVSIYLMADSVFWSNWVS
jgi:hypothetical protein